MTIYTQNSEARNKLHRSFKVIKCRSCALRFIITELNEKDSVKEKETKTKCDVYENCNLKRLALVAENVKNSEAGVFTLPCLYIILNVRNDDAVTLSHCHVWGLHSFMSS